MVPTDTLSSSEIDTQGRELVLPLAHIRLNDGEYIRRHFGPGSYALVNATGQVALTSGVADHLTLAPPAVLLISNLIFGLFGAIIVTSLAGVLGSSLYRCCPCIHRILAARRRLALPSAFAFSNSNPSNRYSEPCTICFEAFAEGENVRKLDCGHLFHTPCIDQWLLSGGHNDCPLCKQDTMSSRGVRSHLATLRDMPAAIVASTPATPAHATAHFGATSEPGAAAVAVVGESPRVDLVAAAASEEWDGRYLISSPNGGGGAHPYHPYRHHPSSSLPPLTQRPSIADLNAAIERSSREPSSIAPAAAADPGAGRARVLSTSPLRGRATPQQEQRRRQPPQHGPPLHRPPPSWSMVPGAIVSPIIVVEE